MAFLHPFAIFFHFKKDSKPFGTNLFCTLFGSFLEMVSVSNPFSTPFSSRLPQYELSPPKSLSLSTQTIYNKHGNSLNESWVVVWPSWISPSVEIALTHLSKPPLETFFQALKRTVLLEPVKGGSYGWCWRVRMRRLWFHVAECEWRWPCVIITRLYYYSMIQISFRVNGFQFFD